MSKDQKSEFRRLFFEKSLRKGVLHTSLYVISIYLGIWLCFHANGKLDSPLAILVVSIVGLLFVTRQMRGLENIVHFGSHNNFVRNRSANDHLTNIMAAWPMLQDVRQYRQFHACHHGEFGSHDDPCKQRFEQIGAIGIEINSNMQLIRAILLWMPQYVREFYREVKSSNQQLLIFSLWHVTVLLVCAISISPLFAVYTAAFWTVAMFGLLPFLRSIAEFSEHDYERGATVRETTFNNLGLLDHLLLHPAGDAWHALHHLHPNVPWWKQGAAHRFLMKHDAAYRMAEHRDDLFQDIAHLPAEKRTGLQGVKLAG